MFITILREPLYSNRNSSSPRGWSRDSGKLFSVKLPRRLRVQGTVHWTLQGTNLFIPWFVQYSNQHAPTCYIYVYVCTYVYICVPACVCMIIYCVFFKVYVFLISYLNDWRTNPHTQIPLWLSVAVRKKASIACHYAVPWSTVGSYLYCIERWSYKMYRALIV